MKGEMPFGQKAQLPSTKAHKTTATGMAENIHKLKAVKLI